MESYNNIIFIVDAWFYCDNIKRIPWIYNEMKWYQWRCCDIALMYHIGNSLRKALWYMMDCKITEIPTNWPMNW